MNIKIKLEEGGRIPEYKTRGSAGADCYARLKEAVTLLPGEIKIIPLGFRAEIPVGYEMQIRPRSGLSARNGIINVLGTIDSDYRGEIGAIVQNASQDYFRINDGDRIAQAVVSPVVKVGFIPCAELSETERGDGGFGHTGK